MLKNTLLFPIIIIIMCLGISHIATAQGNMTEVECGSIVRGEVTPTDNIQQFIIDLKPGDTLTLEVTPVGNVFAAQAAVYFPVESPQLLGNNWNVQPIITATLSVTVSSTGTYIINVHGPNLRNYGAFTLLIGCVLANGDVIEAGEELVSPQPTIVPPQDSAPSVSPVVAVPSFGFPGLAPVDLSTAPLIPMALGQPTQGSIQPAGNAIVGFTFSGQAGQIVDINFVRSAGNLNLGLVVVRSGTTEALFFATLINSTSLESNFTLLTTGDYVVAVFPISLIPPAVPEQTSYAVTVSLVQ